MKKFCITFLLSGIIILSAVLISAGGLGSSNASFAAASEYLRIHIRADSNEERAQAVKLKVRDVVVEYLTPLVAVADSKIEAILLVRQNLENLEAVAERVLAEHGYFYGATAQVKTERFPTRVYDDQTLAAGEYDALIIELGSGKGDNWWCVVYPPLCFSSASGENVKYKSLIKEKIDRWKARFR